MDRKSESVDHSIGAHMHGRNLFLTGFLVLFLELASIRWFAASVIFLQFFANVVPSPAFSVFPAVAWQRITAAIGWAISPYWL
jgi:hypothetical protein